MRKITFYILVLLVLPAIVSAQSVSGNVKTKTPRTCQFKTGIELVQKSPTQLNPLAVVGFTLTKASTVSLSICDEDGNEIVKLLNEDMTAGYHSVQHYIPAIAEGTYYYKFSAETGSRKTEKIVAMLL